MGDGVLAYFGFPLAHGMTPSARSGGTCDHRRRRRSWRSRRRAFAGARRDCDRNRHRGRSSGSGESKSAASSATRRTSPRGCRGRRARPRRHRRRHPQLLGDLFELARSWPRALKGVAAPTPACAALRESMQEAGSGRCTPAMTALVGREKRRTFAASLGQGESGRGPVVCSRARPASASRVWPRRCWSGS